MRMEVSPCVGGVGGWGGRMKQESFELGTAPRAFPRHGDPRARASACAKRRCSGTGKHSTAPQATTRRPAPEAGDEGGPNSLSRPVPAARGGKRKGEPSERGRQAPAPTASQPCRSAAPATDIEAPGNSAHPGPISAADRSCSAQRALTKVGRRSRHQSDRRLLRDLARQCSEANSAANYPPCHPSVNRTTQ